MSSNTKDRLLHDLEALRHQLAEIEASGSDISAEIPTLEAIPTLQADNIPLLGDALPANKEEAIQAHRNAMAQLDAELKDLDHKEQQSSASNDSAAAEPDTQNENVAANDKVASSNETDNTEARNSNPSDSSNLSDSSKTAEPEEQEALDGYLSPTKDDIELAMAAPSIQPSLSEQPTSSEHPELEPVIDPAAAVISSLTQQARKPQGEDNPFLPAHLRERLSQSKSSLLEEIARSSESLDASTALLRNVTGSPRETQHAQAVGTHSDVATEEYQLLVDSLVSKYLPLIEADLRQRLNTALKKQLQGEPA